jgi:hypothetical protein
MDEVCRLGVSIAALRNRNRDGAQAIQCRVAVRRMRRTVLGLGSKCRQDYRICKICEMYPVNPENSVILS